MRQHETTGKHAFYIWFTKDRVKRKHKLDLIHQVNGLQMQTKMLLTDVKQ